MSENALEALFLAFLALLVARLVIETHYQRGMSRLRERVADSPELSEAHAVANRAFLDCGYAPGFAEESAHLVIAEALAAEGERAKLSAEFEQIRALAAECGAEGLRPQIDAAEHEVMRRFGEAAC